jgi:poly(A) polymerase
MHAEPHSEPGTGSDPVRRRGLVPREALDEHAVSVVRRLQRAGHEAYLVGGCVRDLLAGLEPKDFDVATGAHPNRIKRLFRNARVIGRRFRLVHVRFPGDCVIETATFRGDPSRHETDPGNGNGRRDWRDSAENVFGTAREDANRRDFTINALFYDPVEDEVIDWVGGLEDLREGVVRSIGKPSTRIHEDPVRMLRAVHFAERMDFRLEPELEQAIREHADALDDASQARLYVELVKMLTRGRARGTFQRLHELGVLGIWLPELTAVLDEPVRWARARGGTHEEASRGEPEHLPVGHATWNLLGAADRWGLAAHDAPESLALAVLFGPWLLRTWRHTRRQGFHAFLDHLEEVFRPVALRMSVPRWASTQMRDVLWLLAELRRAPVPRRARRTVRRPVFPVALAFLDLDLDARDADSEPADAWRSLAREEGIDLGVLRRARRGGDRRRGGRSGARRGRRDGRGRRGGRGGRRRRRGPAGPEAAAWLDPPEA